MRIDTILRCMETFFLPYAIQTDTSALVRSIVGSGAATVGVVGVRTSPKIQVGVSGTPKKLKGNIIPTSHK